MIIYIVHRYIQCLYIYAYISGPVMSNIEIVKNARKTADIIRSYRHIACCSIQFNIIKSISPLALKVSCLFILHVLLAISFSNHQCHSRPNRNNSIKTWNPPPKKKPKRYEVLLVMATPTPMHFYKLCRAWLSLMMQHHANGVTHVNDVDEYSDNVGDNPHHHYLISM